jgi:hypothetical protein
MKAFLSALVLTAGLAAITGFFAPREMGLTADQAFKSEGARVGEEGTAAARGW